MPQLLYRWGKRNFLQGVATVERIVPHHFHPLRDPDLFQLPAPFKSIGEDIAKGMGKLHFLQ